MGSWRRPAGDSTDLGVCPTEHCQEYRAARRDRVPKDEGSSEVTGLESGIYGDRGSPEPSGEWPARA